MVDPIPQTAVDGPHIFRREVGAAEGIDSLKMVSVDLFVPALCAEILTLVCVTGQLFQQLCGHIFLGFTVFQPETGIDPLVRTCDKFQVPIDNSGREGPEQFSQRLIVHHGQPSPVSGSDTFASGQPHWELQGSSHCRQQS